MFVQALAQFADTNEDVRESLQDEAWEDRPVPHLIELAKDGTFLNITSHMKEVPRGKKTASVPQDLSIPRSPVNRNSGHHPLLGADDISYVLGVGAWTKAKDKEKQSEHIMKPSLNLLLRLLKPPKTPHCKPVNSFINVRVR